MSWLVRGVNLLKGDSSLQRLSYSHDAHFEVAYIIELNPRP